MSEETTPRLGLPMIIGGQAQKHLTLNETLNRIDALLQASVISRTLSPAPVSADLGDCYIVPEGGGWSSFSSGTLVRFDNGQWEAVIVPEGMIAFIRDEACCLVRQGGRWLRLSDTLTVIDDLAGLGVGAQADTYNVLAVKGPGAWMSAEETAYGGSGDFYFKLNKDGANHTAAFLFQEGWSTRAMIGLLGDNHLSLRTSPDGERWNTVWSAHANSGRMRLPAKTYVTANPAQRRYICNNRWLVSQSAADHNWRAVCWSPELGLFAAVAISGTGNRVMTSPDGVNWTLRTSPADNSWLGICWSPERGLFVAVANSGTGNRVMTSPDGLNWTLRSSAADNDWFSVCWSAEAELFVAVSYSGNGNRVMTSPDGINWTARSSAADNEWLGVCWSAEVGLFVAVAISGNGNRVMTSPDGINWTARVTPVDNNWREVCWSAELGLFVSVAATGSGNRVMTSPDGINWTVRNSAADNDWLGVCWSAEVGLFVAVAMSGNADRVMTSPDGINWSLGHTPADNNWRSVCWSAQLGLFVSVSVFGSGNRVMTSVQASGVHSGIRRAGEPGVSTLSADADATLIALVNGQTVRHTATLTADRTLTLSQVNAHDGARFHITRTGSGAFNLSVGGLKALIPNSWCEVTYSAAGACWCLTKYGVL